MAPPNAEEIFLDYQSTTPCDPRVVAAMQPYFSEKFGNPHSAEHGFGWRASAVIDDVRQRIAQGLGGKGQTLIFTSGATEANNLAIKGFAHAKAERGLHGRLVVLATEHQCVLQSAQTACRQDGHEYVVMPVQANGLVDLDRLEGVFKKNALLCAAMAVNNEIGVIQPLVEIGNLCAKYGVHFHCDAAQAYGKIPLDMQAMQIDTLSISGHKIYGPMGIGALFVRKKNPHIMLSPQIEGGSQERGLRAGTLPTPLIVGFGKAADIMLEEGQQAEEKLSQLRSNFVTILQKRLTNLQINGDLTARIAGNIHITFLGVTPQALLAKIPHIAVSGGAACSSASAGGSHVLRALRVLNDDTALNAASLRFGFGRFSTRTEVCQAASDIVAAIQSLKD